MSNVNYVKSLEKFMIKVASIVECLPDFNDPANENDHILNKIKNLNQYKNENENKTEENCPDCGFAGNYKYQTACGYCGNQL